MPGVLLWITGDCVPEADLRTLEVLAELTGRTVVMLFDVPNQPIFDRREDDLIAHSFEQYLVTQDAEWPLLVPMARAAVRLIQFLRQAEGWDQFAVSGMSKRGWTAWWVGLSGLKEVRGISPMVFDNLNMLAQMRAQMELWGRYSPRLDDYTVRQLQTLAETPAGAELAKFVDPYAQIQRLSVPVLSIQGSCDEFWRVDALKHYAPRLTHQIRTYTVPNQGHDLGDRRDAFRTLASWLDAIFEGGTLPLLTARSITSGAGDQRAQSMEVTSDRAWERLRVWQATSDQGWFVDPSWRSIEEHGPGTKQVLPQACAVRTYTARYCEAEYRTEAGQLYRLSTPPVLMP